MWRRPINCWFKNGLKKEGNTEEGKVGKSFRLEFSKGKTVSKLEFSKGKTVSNAKNPGLMPKLLV